MKIFLAVAALVLLQDSPSKPDPGAELKALRADYQKAEQEYYRPMREAKTAEERSKVKLDPEKHPARAFVPKAVDLAQRAAGTETGAQSHLWVVQLAGNVGMKEEAEDSIQVLVTEYVKSPLLERVASGLEYSQGTYGADFCREVLISIQENSPHAGARAAALFVRGLHAMRADPKEAQALLERVRKEFPETPYAKRAAGSLFEVNNLQIGMKAPDIEGTDENGKPIRLSQFRGKVVVLDFWGFW
jgi:hypothetical protein